MFLKIVHQIKESFWLDKTLLFFFLKLSFQKKSFSALFISCFFGIFNIFNNIAYQGLNILIVVF